MKPARQIVTRSPYRDVGAIHAPYIQPDPIEWESLRERSFGRLALPCPVVSSIQFQPFKITYEDSEGQSRKHTPDFLVLLLSGCRLVVEVKTTPYIAKHREKFDRAAEKMRANGAWYYVITEKHLDQAREDRAEIWRRYARAPAPPTEVGLALQLVRDSHAGLRCSELRSAGISIETLYHLLGRRVLDGGLALDISEHTTLNFPEVRKQDDRILFDRWFGCAPWGEDLSTQS